MRYSLLVILLLAACESETEPLTTNIQTDHSIEVSYETIHLNDSFDVLIEDKKFWNKHTLVKEVQHRDTIPGLDFVVMDAENESGEVKPAYVKKDYEIFVTIK